MATTQKKTSTAAMAMAIFVALVCIATVAAGWTFSSGLMYPTYQCTEEHFLYCGDPSQLRLDFENVVFSSDDGIDLSGWYIPALSRARRLFLSTVMVQIGTRECVGSHQYTLLALIFWRLTCATAVRVEVIFPP